MEKIEELTADKERLKNEQKARDLEREEAREAERAREREKYEAKYREWERERADLLQQLAAGKPAKKLGTAASSLLGENEKSTSGGKLEFRERSIGSVTDRGAGVGNRDSASQSSSQTGIAINTNDGDGVPTIHEPGALTDRPVDEASGAVGPRESQGKQGKLKKTFSYRPGERIKSMKLTGKGSGKFKDKTEKSEVTRSERESDQPWEKETSEVTTNASSTILPTVAMPENGGESVSKAKEDSPKQADHSNL